jgi:hypothetical protein
MPALDAVEFAELLANQPLEDLAREYVFGGVPFVFEGDEPSWQLLRTHLAQNLGINQADIYVVGSAKLGFSLSPNGFPRAFSEESDIDIAVVSAELFDKAWHSILDWNYPRRYRLKGVDLAWARLRQEDVYWGWFRVQGLGHARISRPASLASIRTLRTAWFNAFRSLALYPAFASRDVSGRLYRTLDHAVKYTTSGLEQIKSRLEGGST